MDRNMKSDLLYMGRNKKKMKERIVYTVYLLNSTRQYIIETIYAYNYLSLKWHARDLTRTNITRQNHSNIHSLNISLPLRSDRDQQKKILKNFFEL